MNSKHSCFVVLVKHQPFKFLHFDYDYLYLEQQSKNEEKFICICNRKTERGGVCRASRRGHVITLPLAYKLTSICEKSSLTCETTCGHGLEALFPSWYSICLSTIILNITIFYSLNTTKFGTEFFFCFRTLVYRYSRESGILSIKSRKSYTSA